MKKVTKSILALLVIAAAVQSCKKGEEDPSISLRSRKSRVAGDWKVASIEETRTSTYQAGYNAGNPTPSTSTTINKETSTDGSNYTKTTTNSSTAAGSVTCISTWTGKASSLTYTFDKEGKWTSVSEIVYSTYSNSCNPSTGGTCTGTSTVKVTSEGTWNFLGKVDSETKNKEEIAVSTAKSTTVTTDVTTCPSGTVTEVNTDIQNWARNEMVSVWRLVELKNKEIKITYNGKFNSSGSDVTTSSITGYPGGTYTASNSTSETTGSMMLTQ